MSILEEIQQKLNVLTGQPAVALTSRGNAAIYAALYCVKKLNAKKKTILVPDQGGWLTYKQYPEKLNLDYKEVKTEYGILDLEDLQKKAKKALAIIYSQPAGYHADPPMKEIYEICKKERCYVIMDVAGSIGTTYCDGSYADFMVCSFGRWKPINAHHGGCVTAAQEEYLTLSKEIFEKHPFDPLFASKVIEKINNLPKRYAFFEKKIKEVKDDLEDLNIIHRDKWGLVVIIKYADQEEKEMLISYCNNKGFEYTECPRYIRVNEQAICIEVKRLE